MIALLAYAVCRLRGHAWRETWFGDHSHTVCHRCGAWRGLAAWL